MPSSGVSDLERERMRLEGGDGKDRELEDLWEDFLVPLYE